MVGGRIQVSGEVKEKEIRPMKEEVVKLQRSQYQIYGTYGLGPGKCVG